MNWKPFSDELHRARIKEMNWKRNLMKCEFITQCDLMKRYKIKSIVLYGLSCYWAMFAAGCYCTCQLVNVYLCTCVYTEIILNQGIIKFYDNLAFEKETEKKSSKRININKDASRKMPLRLDDFSCTHALPRSLSRPPHGMRSISANSNEAVLNAMLFANGTRVWLCLLLFSFSFLPLLLIERDGMCCPHMTFFASI